MEFLKKGEVAKQLFPVKKGDITTLGGIPCTVEYVNYGKNTASVKFADNVGLIDSQEKGLAVKKFGPIANRRDKRAHKATKDKK